MKLKIAVDIDGTLVENYPSDRIFEAPGIPEMIEKVNKLFDAGHEIVIYTARGMSRLKGQQHLIPFEYLEKTRAQLDRLGVRYTTIVFGKLDFDVLFDDKAFNVEDCERSAVWNTV